MFLVDPTWYLAKMFCTSAPKTDLAWPPLAFQAADWKGRYKCTPERQLTVSSWCQTLLSWKRARSKMSGFFVSLLWINAFIIKKENLPARLLMFALQCFLEENCEKKKWLKWNWQGNCREFYHFQGQSPENLLVDWENQLLPFYSVFFIR